jgi:hypothetical protein
MTRVIVANLVYSNRPMKTRRIVRQIRDRWGSKDDRVVFLFVETKRGRVRGWLGRGWRTHQGWQPGRSNNAVAWDRDMGLGQPRFDLLTRPEGSAMLTRWMNSVTQPEPYVVVHHPPSRYQHLVPAAMQRMSRLYSALDHGQTWGGDQNSAPVEEWAKQRAMNYRHAGVMFIATHKHILRFDAHRVEGLDHAVLVVDLAD